MADIIDNLIIGGGPGGLLPHGVLLTKRQLVLAK